MISKHIYSRWMAAAQRAKIQELLKHVKFSFPVLDVGAGPGFLEEKISAVAADVNLADLKKFSGSRVLASGGALPFADRTFGTVFCIDTVHLVQQPAELARVLIPGGQLIVSLPCSRWNAEAKLQKLVKKFSPLQAVQRFVIRTEPEWDAVVVFATQGP